MTKSLEQEDQKRHKKTQLQKQTGGLRLKSSKQSV